MIRHNEDQNEDQQTPLGPRGGNSGMSIPPGADLDDGYATDDWPVDAPEPDAAPAESEADSEG
jgi:hypothetical protein